MTNRLPQVVSGRRTGERAADGRRRAGDLETAVLGVLWASPQSVTPAEVVAKLANGLSYSTIVTILVRLRTKGVIARERSGRGFAYRPMMSEADLATEQIRRILRTSTNRSTDARIK